jgi:hypothetical protein
MYVNQTKLLIGVSSFKYLGNMIHNGNRNYNCVKERYKLETGLISQILAHLKAK